MNGCQIASCIGVKVKYPLALPVFKRPDDILLGIVESVRDIADGGFEIGTHHTYEIQIHLKLGIIGIRHIFIDEPVRKDRRIYITVLIDRKL